MQYQLIEKEAIFSMKFPHKEITSNRKKELLKSLEQAMTLGNSYKSKCRIVFEDTEGLKAVETTVWFADDNAVELKGDAIIPLANIIEIQF